MFELEHYKALQNWFFTRLPKTLLLDLDVNKRFLHQSEQNFNPKKPRKVTLVKGFHLNKRKFFFGLHQKKLTDRSLQLSLKF